MKKMAMSILMYKQFFDINQTKEQFIKSVLQKYPYLKPQSIKRRYYDLRKTDSPKPVVLRSNIFNIADDETNEPPLLKKLILQDAKRLNYKITKNFLLQHGFNIYEINWLMKKNEVEINE